MSQVIEDGTTAVVHYTGSFPDGEVFDSSEGKDPLAYQVGKQQMIPGFEQEMMGAAVGLKERIHTNPRPGLRRTLRGCNSAGASRSIPC
ncbi:MAG: hypothetical protein Ct9H90mP14_2160 [Methanobacteriota archaeon]|nr:MAG: hypothetical protein Ct9H90mP14_2160 [Euryarchaeota archaeon]